MSRQPPLGNEVRRFQRWCLWTGIAALVACGIGFVFSPQQFFRSYLFAYLFWLSIGLGCLPLLMLYHLVGGAWGYSIRRLLESGTRTILALAILFIPILAGMRQLYAERRTALVDELQNEFGSALEVLGSHAGMHLAVTLPKGRSKAGWSMTT